MFELCSSLLFLASACTRTRLPHEILLQAADKRAATAFRNDDLSGVVACMSTIYQSVSVTRAPSGECPDLYLSVPVGRLLSRRLCVVRGGPLSRW